MTLAKLAQNSKVSVVGAGISGLTYAYFLAHLRPDLTIKIFERQSRVGGYINTTKANKETQRITGLSSSSSLRMEKGPRTLRGVSPGTLIIVDLLKRIGMINQLRGVPIDSPGNKKYLLTKHRGNDTQFGLVTGDLIEVPSPGCKLSTIVKFFATSYGKIIMLSIFRDYFFKPDGKALDGMSVEEFFTRHFGKELINEIGSALMYGIYAADVSDLNVNNVMPSLVQLEKESGGSIIKALLNRNKKNKDKEDATTPNIAAVDANVQSYVDFFGSEFNMTELSTLLKKYPMLTLEQGLGSLCDGLRDHMPGNVELAIGEGVDEIIDNGNKITLVTNKGKYECDFVRSTINTLYLSKMIQDEKLREKLAEFEYTSVGVCNVLLPYKAKEYEGFGFLVPKSQLNNSKLMGVIFDSDVDTHSVGLFNKDPTPPQDSQQPYTRVTMMLKVDRGLKKPKQVTISGSHFRHVVQDTFTNVLGTGQELRPGWACESGIWWDSIPLYDSAFNERRVQTTHLLGRLFGGKLSMGGMVFAPGVGVPDAVVGSWRAVMGCDGLGSIPMTAGGENTKPSSH